MGYLEKLLEERCKLALHKDEKSLLIIKQSLLSDFAPSFVMATDKRLVIQNNSFWGLYLGHNFLTPTDSNFIPYKKITSVIHVRGIQN